MPGMPPSQLAGRLQGMELSCSVFDVQPENKAARAAMARAASKGVFKRTMMFYWAMVAVSPLARPPRMEPALIWAME